MAPVAVPEYTISLLIWIIPSAVLTCFLFCKRLLTREKTRALFITVGAIAAVSFSLDIAFAQRFFLFPNARAILNVRICAVPVEEFVFWLTGNWFILSLYVFCDEWYFRKYNRPDPTYARYRSKVKRFLHAHHASVYIGLALLLAGFIVKRLCNPAGDFVPGYYFFLVLFAYVPAILFFRITRRFVNWQAFAFCLAVTVLVCLIWEVTLALPRGYWNYRHDDMLGLYIGVWNGLPIEEATVWFFCSMEILVYEFVKIWFCVPLRPPRQRPAGRD